MIFFSKFVIAKKWRVEWLHCSRLILRLFLLFLQKANIDSSKVNLTVEGNLSIPDRLSSKVVAAAKAVWSDQVLAEIATSVVELISKANKSNRFFQWKILYGSDWRFIPPMGFKCDFEKKQKLSE
jgi:hypothetical protein